MSLPVVTFYCTQCDFRSGDARTWGTREYQLPNGVCIPLSRTLGWCNDCANLAPIEDLSEESWLADIQRAEAEVSMAGEMPPIGRWRILRFVLRGSYRDLV